LEEKGWYQILLSNDSEENEYEVDEEKRVSLDQKALSKLMSSLNSKLQWKTDRYQLDNKFTAQASTNLQDAIDELEKQLKKERQQRKKDNQKQKSKEKLPEESVTPSGSSSKSNEDVSKKSTRSSRKK